MTKSSRTRLQLELATQHRLLLHVLGEGMGSGGDAETSRRVFDIIENLADAFVRDTSSPSCRWMTSTQTRFPNSREH